MTPQDFPALAHAVRSSALRRATASAIRVLRSAADASQIASFIRSVRHRVQSFDPVERIGMLGVVLMSAGTAHYVLTRLQPPHQAPVSAPALAGMMVVAGLIMAIARASLASSYRHSRAWTLLRRLFR